jgi:aspartate kinase
MKIGGILEHKDLTHYRIASLEDKPGEAGKVLSAVAALHINMEYITESSCHKGHAIVSFCINKQDEAKVDGIESLMNNGFSILKTPNVSVIGIYGPHFREKPGIAAQYFSLLGSGGVNILGVSSSFSSLCCVLDDIDCDKAKHLIRGHYEMP